MINLRTALVIVLCLAIFDGIWLNLNSRTYATQYSGVQGSPMIINTLGAALSYATIFASVVFIVIPQLKQSAGTLADCARIGGILGLCIYGIYNFTNMATFTNYKVSTAIMDTLWGGALYTMVAYALVKTGSV